MDSTSVYVFDGPANLDDDTDLKFNVPGLYPQVYIDEAANFRGPYADIADVSPIATTGAGFGPSDQAPYLSQQSLSFLPTAAVPATSTPVLNERPPPPSKSIVAKHPPLVKTTHSHLFHCNLCRQRFTQRKSLLRHERSVHQNDLACEQFKCDICESSFKRKDIRDRHVKFQHNNDKVECMVCGSEVSERAINRHWQSAACKTMQAMSDARQLADISKPCRVDSAGKFGVESVADIWVMAANLFAYWVCMTGVKGSCPVDLDLYHFLQLKGVVMRALKKLLVDCPRTQRMAALAATFVLNEVDNYSSRRFFRRLWNQLTYNWFTSGDNCELCLGAPPLQSKHPTLLTAIPSDKHDPHLILHDLKSDGGLGGLCVFILGCRTRPMLGALGI